jgi:hypothetical protein
MEVEKDRPVLELVSPSRSKLPRKPSYGSGMSSEGGGEDEEEQKFTMNQQYNIPNLTPVANIESLAFGNGSPRSRMRARNESIGSLASSVDADRLAARNFVNSGISNMKPSWNHSSPEGNSYDEYHYAGQQGNFVNSHNNKRYGYLSTDSEGGMGENIPNAYPRGRLGSVGSSSNRDRKNSHVSQSSQRSNTTSRAGGIPGVPEPVIHFRDTTGYGAAAAAASGGIAADPYGSGPHIAAGSSSPPPLSFAGSIGAAAGPVNGNANGSGNNGLFGILGSMSPNSTQGQQGQPIQSPNSGVSGATGSAAPAGAGAGTSGFPAPPGVDPLPPSSNLDSRAEDAILEQIEQIGHFGSLGVPDVPTLGAIKPIGSRNRTASVQAAAASGLDPQIRARLQRKGSVDSTEYANFDVNQLRRLQGWQHFVLQLKATIKYLTPNLTDRINFYMVLLFLLLVMIVADYTNTPVKLCQLYACTAALEFVCSILDRILYKVIDVLFSSRFDIAYLLHSLNGPFGMLITVLIIKSQWGRLEADSLIKDWDNGVTAATVIIICLIAKNLITRRQYVFLLEKRFSDKVEALNSKIIILSELASTRPPKSSKIQRQTSMGVPESSSLNTLNNATNGLATKVRNVFTEIVDLDNDKEEDPHGALTKKQLYMRRTSFWQSAERLNSTAGCMSVITYNGVVTIRSQEQAKKFGKMLYKHLSKGGKILVTPELIHRLFEERSEIVLGDIDEKTFHDKVMSQVLPKSAAVQAATTLSSEDEEARHSLSTTAVMLFDPFNLGKISEEFCVDAVLGIYKEQRFAASSINDFGELHQSLRIIVDIVYWIIMIFVLQSIFGFDLTTYLLPFITLLVTVSFAIAPLVGNLFLAFAFVFFMAPFDIGHKIQFGVAYPSYPPLVGYIQSITLLHTIVNSTRNETV